MWNRGVCARNGVLKAKSGEKKNKKKKKKGWCVGVLFAATGKRAKYDSAPSTLPIGPLLSRKQDKCAYFSASCGGERCVYVRLLGADSKNFEKGSPLSFFSVGWGRVWQRLCVCVCVQGVLCGLSFRFCVRSDQIKKFEMESPPRRKRRRAHTHNTYRERERVPTLRCCISVGTTRVCVCAYVCVVMFHLPSIFR